MPLPSDLGAVAGMVAAAAWDAAERRATKLSFELERTADIAAFRVGQQASVIERLERELMETRREASSWLRA